MHWGRPHLRRRARGAGCERASPPHSACAPPCGSRYAGGEGRVPGGAPQARAAVGGGRDRHGAVQAQGAAPQVGVAGKAGEAAAGDAGGGAASRGDATAPPALAPGRGGEDRHPWRSHPRFGGFCWHYGNTESKSLHTAGRAAETGDPAQPTTAQDLTSSIFPCKWHSRP